MSTYSQDYDNIMGTVTRVPRLECAEDFVEWKHRFKDHVMMKEPKIWRSIEGGPVKITTTMGDGVTTVDKERSEYTDDDLDLCERDDKMMATLCMALTPAIAQGFRSYKNAQSLWDALSEVYDGNADMKASRRDLLRQQFDLFNHELGESIETQLQRFVKLTTDMSAAGVIVPRPEINRKLVNSLPRNWDSHVSLIKTTKNLARITLAETMAVIKAFEMEDKHRERSHMNSYSSANIGIASSNAFSTLPANVASSSNPPVTQFHAQGVTASNLMPKTPPAVVKLAEEHLTLGAGFMSCYNAFIAGDLTSPVVIGDLDQVHPEDVEEMDIVWQIAMAVFRAKQFTQKTGRNAAWSMNPDKKMGFNKNKLRCFNCHEPGHFARECPQPRNENNYQRNIVPVTQNAAVTQTSGDRAMVAQQFSWEDQIKDLNVGGDEKANLAQIAGVKKADDQVSTSQHALMVSATSATHEVNLTSCTLRCTKLLNYYRAQYDEGLRREAFYKSKVRELKKIIDPLQDKVKVTSKDLYKLKNDFQEKCIHYNLVSAELETLKNKFENAEFNFKKFDVSSPTVENIIAKQLQFQGNKKKGLGYQAVPPPYNDNYTPNLPLYGDDFFKYNATKSDSVPTESVRFDSGQPSKPVVEHVFITNSSTLCTGKQVTDNVDVKSDVVNDESVLKTFVGSACIVKDFESFCSFSSVNSGDVVSTSCRDDNILNVSLNLDNSAAVNSLSRNLEKPSVLCACDCQNSLKPKQNSFSSSSGSGQNSPTTVLKKQTCFNCGIPGHIARNCPYYVPVPLYEEQLHEVTKRKSLKPKGRPVSKRINIPAKPNFQWIPKVFKSESCESSVSFVSKDSDNLSVSSENSDVSVFDTKDMTWANAVKYGRPGVKLTWVPRSN